ncbi:phosphonate ABC transporter, permease protein PhnE [Alsobacter metallidurans]|uniref:Phosphonate ABC transporter, permease protein PhnE n=1 Tax=Alsobacter metallidurans TaxID=340221 RepID=A0A917I6L9_9HYPH|nr:phosphonate ABC transporter, permease protein PhnE [Alsobacter metallidurans]GGH16003.1 phosphonate ABC transporter, permease protein PhnE [Alsobacter metallidurans]
MATAIPHRPDAQNQALVDGYEAAIAARRRRTLLGIAILAALILAAARISEVDLGTFFGNLGRFTSYIGRIFTLEDGHLVFTNPAEWLWGLRKWLRLLGETLLIAYLGTVIGGLGAFGLSFLAARNMVVAPWLRFSARRFLEFCRTVPELVFALIFVVAFGLGPLPGVLALGIHTMGALGKLFAEVVENIDMKPVEGVAATGANWAQGVRFGTLPQVLSNFVSYTLLRFEVNVRGAAIMGFVGAGGIGQDLVEAIRKFYYSDVSAILMLIVVTVMLIDLVTERARHALIGRELGR